MMILGIAGRAGSGKGTYADFLRSEFYRRAFTVELMNFAAPLKRFLKEVFDFSDEQLYGALKETPDPRYTRADGQPLTMRHAIKTLGTEWGRACYPDVWADLGLRLAAASTANIVIFDDVRFVNEAQKIVGAGGRIYLMRRELAETVVSTHESELTCHTPEFLKLVNVEVSNNGDLESLKHRANAEAKWLSTGLAYGYGGA